MRHKWTFPAFMLLGCSFVGWIIATSPNRGLSLAQEQSPARRFEAGVAVLDVARALKSYPLLQDQLAKLREEAEKLQQEGVVRQTEIDSVTRQLQQLDPGTPEHERKQLLLVRLQTELKQWVDRNKKQFLDQEASHYRQAYDTLEEVVARYAEKRDIQIVLRLTQPASESGDPQAILASVNRPVVYHNGLDITDDIVQRLRNQSGELQ